MTKSEMRERIVMAVEDVARSAKDALGQFELLAMALKDEVEKRR